MAPSAIHDTSDPLLNRPSKLVNDLSFFPSLSSTTQTAIKVLSFIRIATGLSCLIAPCFTGKLFNFPVPVEQTLLVRMCGARDIVLGELLFTAEDKGREDRGRREVRRAIWAGIAMDVVDIGSVAFGVATGSINKTAGLILLGGALGTIAMAAMGLKGL